PAVWALLDNANHATFGVSGAYWWPHLKPRRFPRHFEPDTEYDLVDVQLAHRIQRDKALAFFDLTIRQDPSARERLTDGRYEGEGLELEWRNL
ncbi:MAG: acetylhydrolase, partial [Gammaproteobacteria bacterium]|nr:acetylhydrolase [Gammaproteobacteria bacterium]